MAVYPFPVGQTNQNQSGFSSRRVILQSVEAKKQIVNQVIDGGLRLLDAAERFQAIQKSSNLGIGPGNGATTLPRIGMIDQEMACRTVIGWVALVLSDRPEQADLISDRLERELQGYLEKNALNSTPVN